MNNLEYYNNWAACPKEAQRPIKAGKLVGKTDINPMWRIKMLTAQFGPCGYGWTTKITEHWVERDNGESVAWIRLELRVRINGEWTEPIEGVGGSKQCGKGQGDGINDEAFKMAETDALSVACKKLGMAADIYWSSDRTKYNPGGAAAAAESPKTGQEKPVKRMPERKTKPAVTAEMLEAGQLQSLVDWLAPHFDPATGEFTPEKYNQLWNGYQWDSPDTFSRVAAAAAGQAAKKGQ